RRADGVRELLRAAAGAVVRLVVVQPRPLEADEVRLRERRVAAGDQRRELVADPERRLVELDPLDRVPLEDGLPGGRRRHSGTLCDLTILWEVGCPVYCR